MSTQAKTRGGIIYLLHFERPYRHARHYIGYCDDLDARLERHRAGTGARLTAAASAAGIAFVVARTWTGKHATRNFERRLHRRRDAVRMCPLCTPSPKPAHVLKTAPFGPTARSLTRECA